MALNYPGFVAPQRTTTTLLDVLDSWNKGEAAGKEQRFEREAPEVFAKSAAPLSDFGLTTPTDELRAMFANPNTRPMALQMVQEATQRRDDASDPVKQLQLRKLQYDVDNLGRVDPTATMREFQMAQDNPAFAEFIGGKGAGKAPAAVQEYMWYRQNEIDAGRQPLSYLEFGQAQKGNGTSLSVDPATGAVTFQQGGATTSSMPKLTEQQSKDVVFLTRGAGALETLNTFDDALTDPVQQVMGVDPTGLVRGQQDPKFQQAEQAGREFLASILRKDTGAAVTPSEMETYGAMYIARPGDTPELLQQKADARGRALKAMELGIPPAAILAMEEKGVLPGRGAAEKPTRPTKTIGGKNYYQDEAGDWYEE